MLSKISVAAYTPGKDVPSARFRLRQHLNYLHSKGIYVKEFYPARSIYPPIQRSRRFDWAIEVLGQRAWQTVISWRFDLVFLQREMISTFFTFEAFTKKPRVLDVDDAIWLKGRNTSRRLCQCCDIVICGNNYLAEQFSKWNRNVTVLPTAVDTKRFVPAAKPDKHSGKCTIVWSGTSGGFQYLYAIEKALAALFSIHNDIVLRVISEREPKFSLLGPDKVEYLPWNVDNEMAGIQSADIGIMPLADSAWERGKCSYKLLLYMACGLPVVASPIGMNAEVLAMGDIGVAASNMQQWVDGLKSYIDNPEQARVAGSAGRKIVERNFSCDVIAPRLADLLMGVC